MTLQLSEQIRQEIRADGRRFLIWYVSILIVAMAAGAAIFGLILHLTGRL